MAGIGIDIAEVFAELGVEITILRSPVNLQEKIVYEVNALSANTFLREHLLNCSLAYNTNVVTGDIILFHDCYYLVVNKTADDFENSIVEYSSTLYKCNMPSTAKLLRPNDTINGTTFVITHNWTVITDLLYGVITQDKRTTRLDDEVSEGKQPVWVLECFIPSSNNAAIGDRIYLSSVESYRVQDIEYYRFPGVHVIYLVNDDRIAYPVPEPEIVEP